MNRLCGFPPFYEDTNEKLFEMIKKGQFEFPSPQWDPISNQAKDLIKGLLKVDPADRFNADKVLAHPWVKDGGAPRKHLPQSLEALRQFNARRRLRVRELFIVRLLANTNSFVYFLSYSAHNSQSSLPLASNRSSATSVIVDLRCSEFTHVSYLI